MNLVVLVGRLGRDAEVKHTTAGTVCNLSLATDERVGRGQERRTTWHKVVVWSSAAASLKKGELVAVEGRLRTEKWKDKQGRARETLEVVCWHVRRLGADAEASS